MSLPVKAAAWSSRDRLRKTPGTEVEIKLRVPDRKAVLRRLRKLKARGAARMHEMNTLYDTLAGSLAREGKLVRIRVLSAASSVRGAGKASGKGSRAASPEAIVLTFKGPVQNESSTASFHGRRYKIREEHELRVEDADALARVFEGMGLRPFFRYEKYRTTYRLPGVAGLVVELDETPIGDFLELEGDPAAIDRVAAMLGYRTADYITKSYGQLYVEERRSAARAASNPSEGPLSAVSADMLFPHRR